MNIHATPPWNTPEWKSTMAREKSLKSDFTRITHVANFLELRRYVCFRWNGLLSIEAEKSTDGPFLSKAKTSVARHGGSDL
jgi:hypothetical protein